MIKSDSQSAFHFIPKVLDGAEVRALCEPVQFYHSKLGKQFLYGAGFVHSGNVMKRENTHTVDKTGKKHYFPRHHCTI